MGFLDLFSKIFRRKSSQIELSSSESSVNSSHSIGSDKSEEQRPEAIPLSVQVSTQFPTSFASPESSQPKIEEESYHLGLAAGYTGRSIKEIESSLGRIESQMATKDWVELKLREQFDKIVETLKGNLPPAADQIPEPVQPFQSRLPLTPRMEEVLIAVKELGQVNYDDLAIRLNMNVDELRSLLSIMTRRTDKLERFRIGRRGWIRYKGQKDSE